MDCSACGHPNRAGAKFCDECGVPCASTCASCETQLRAGAKFCDECGTPTGGTSRATDDARRVERSPRDYTPQHLADKILLSKSALEGERKHVTVMFADVQGSMDLAEQVGAEKWHHILDRFFQILADGVHRFEGTVNQYTGDGIMALFGAPIAHEDHGQRACFAALHLQDTLRGYADELRRSEGVNLAARIGLNSGEVIVGRIGDDLRMDYTAQGHTVGLAQRMESRAAPDSTYLTEHTANLVEGYFELRDLGEFDLKGASEVVRGYELKGVGAVRTRLDRSRARGFAKFVGRDREIAALDSALEEAIAGNGQVMGVVADAGTGKSRLCAEFIDRCIARGIRVNVAHCPAHGKNIPYLPVFEIFRDIFEIKEQDSDHDARRKIAGELALLDEKFQAMLPLLFDFLGVADPTKPALQISPEARQQQLFAFVRHLPEARSRNEPAVLLLDDLHWIDPGSDAFLAHSVDAVPGTRTLWLVNFRPEYHADWMAKSYYRQIPLRPLGREAIDELLLDLMGADTTLAEVSAQIYDRTAGNPFFVEEVVQSLVENGSLSGERGAYRLTAAVEQLEIPTTVQSVLSARIDRLPEREKRTLQTASVIDKEFSKSILARVAELADTDLTASLATLVQAEFLLEKQLYPDAEYGFKHPLTQEVAYTSLLGERRAELHRAVARAIEEADPDRLDSRAALLAHHWEKAGDEATAATWHGRAARHAGLDSPAEALRHWERVWEILSDDASESALTSLRVEAASMILRVGVRQGIPLPRAQRIFDEGQALARAQGDSRALVGLLYGYGVAAFLLNGSAPDGIPVFEEAVAIADADGDPELRWAAREPLVTSWFYVGELHEAVRVSDELMDICNDVFMEIPVTSFTVAWGLGPRGWALLELGRFEEAAECLRRGVEAYDKIGEKEQASWISAFRARCLARMGDVEGALASSQRAVGLAEEVGSHLALVNAYGHHGVALIFAGEWRAAVARLEQTLEIVRANQVWLSLEGDFLASLAEAQLGAGDGTRARRNAEDAVRIARETRTPTFELHAHLALARAVIETAGRAAETEATAALDAADALMRQTKARSFAPVILEGRARLANARADFAAADVLRREARDLYAEMGATGHSERLAADLSKD